MVKISKVVLLLVAFTLVFGLFSVEIKDPDFWWHLKTGEYISQHHKLPQSDPFAYTSLSKDPLHPESKRIKFILLQYWLAQLIFYQVYHVSGFQGIIFLRASLLTILMLILYKCMRREGAGFYTAMLSLLPTVVIFHAFTGERPQLFSFLFSFLLIYLLEGFRKTAGNINSTKINRDSVELGGGSAETRGDTAPGNLKESQISDIRPAVYGLRSTVYLLPLPFIMLFWANLHGGFILGTVIILGYICTETLKYISKRFGTALPAGRLKILAGIGLLSVITPLANPNGYNVLSVLFEFEKSPYRGMIIESMPPLLLLRSGFHEAYMVLYIVLLAVSLLIMLANIKKLDLTDAAITVGLAAMSLSSSRYIPFFSPVAAIMTVRYGSKMMAGWHAPGIIRTIREKADLSLSVLLTIALIIVINNSNLFRSGIKANNYPERAVKFLKENRISGNMFNPYVWGGYLIWALYPDYKVFVDGRGLIGEVFFQEVKVMDAYQENLAGLPEWKAILSAYNVDSIITYSVGNFTGRLVPLIPALLHDPEWQLVYFDDISLIFVRENSGNDEIIRKFALPKEWLWNEVAVEAAIKGQSDKNNINYLITQGDALLQKQSYIDAKAAYLKALQMVPGNGLVQRRLDFIRSRGY
jgi:hypothetical protein